MQPTVELANLGIENSLILMVLALVVFGPRRLPEIGRQIGKLMYEFRKASNDFKFQMEEELRMAEEAERRKKDEERLKLAAPAAVESKVPESHAEAPDSATASPYPGEDQYPEAPAVRPAFTEVEAASIESNTPIEAAVQPEESTAKQAQNG